MTDQPTPDPRRPEGLSEATWDTNHDGLRQIFCSALAGICANPAFFGPVFQQSPMAAVNFADAVVLAAMKSDGGRLALTDTPDPAGDARG